MSKLFRPAFAAWIMSWAATTFVSAAFRTDPVEASVMDWLAQWFATADAVPPFAKIAFGSMLAAGFWILAVSGYWERSQCRYWAHSFV